LVDQSQIQQRLYCSRIKLNSFQKMALCRFQIILYNRHTEVLRINGRAEIVVDPELSASFAMNGKLPKCVLVVTADRVYTQCPKAIIRARLWDPAQHRDPATLPSVGEILSAITDEAFDGQAYDTAYPERIRATIY
jgi:predicted pyridoxine 5'-phosphate oxidase superfamily flavin-nucleotide-binding protein